MTVDKGWFEVRRVNHDLWMIAEPLHVVSWLYVGRDRAVLIDSGMGIMPIKPVVERLTDKPVTLINTHYHFDHVGGNGEFYERLAGERGGPLLERRAPRDLLDRYLRGFPAIIAEARARLVAEPDFYALTPETEPRDFPSTFDAQAWMPGGVPATGLLREDDEVDLGDRKLLVIDTPGHSPDGICLFDERHGVLFAGDTLMEGGNYVQYDESSMEDLLASVIKLSKLSAPVHAICTGHVPRAIAEETLITDTADALTEVLNGAAYRMDTDIFGYPVRVTRVGRVWVYASDGAATSYPLHD
jgi:glyoxylase-like metal-dependent hydrolase (beta-lactamase superfamily II)